MSGGGLLLGVIVSAVLLTFLAQSMWEARKYEAKPPMITMTLTMLMLIAMLTIMVYTLVKVGPW